ncbi:PQQ-like beta-propeller repeat protein [Candidatus Pelagibacter sp.]|nr:PQQ-like beta-propeller repeat protein [Candidatus Pelagibacter sp.]
MSNILKIFLIFFLITGCSFHKNSTFWSNEKIVEESQEQQKDIIEIFEKEEAMNNEFNPSLKINLKSKIIDKSLIKNFNKNNDERINFNGMLNKVSKFKFKKIKNFHQYEHEITFNKDNIIFFDNNGSILNFDNKSNLLWKKNYYSKSEKKQNPALFFAHDNNHLIVADSIAKLYALNINTGELLWSKLNKAPFNSQIKVYKDNFYIIDFENTIRAYSLKDGKEIWKNKTQDSFIRSNKKLSLVIVEEKIYFNNSLGDISAIDINTGDLIWQTPTQNNLEYDSGFFLKTSDIVADQETLFFSNNKNEFFSLNMLSGNINWKQKINSNLRPSIINNFIFTISLEGYLIVIEKNSGNIIRSTDLFSKFIKKKGKIAFLSDKKMNPLYAFNKKVRSDNKNSSGPVRPEFKPTGFIIGKNNIYLSTDHGRLFIINTTTGTTETVIKLHNSKISRPSVINKNLYVIAENTIIKLD